MSSQTFYNRLSSQELPLAEILSAHQGFEPLPEDWSIIITDIKDSTRAVSRGLHRQVNLVATASTVLVLNIAFEKDLRIPFFFGGDGATFLVPPALENQFMEALRSYSIDTLKNYNLILRVGLVPVKDIYSRGHELLIAKYQYSKSFAIPVVLGEGLEHAEALIKSYDFLPREQDRIPEPDLTGMLCRWDTIPAPQGKDLVVALLVKASQGQGKRKAELFATIMKEIESIYGSPTSRQPITISKLKLRSTFKRLGAEMKSGTGGKWVQLAGDLFFNFAGYIYFMTGKGQKYLRSLVEMSDTLVIDGKINTIISGNHSQKQQLVHFLDAMEKRGEIHYGLHTSSSSIMSCYVRNARDGHIYFVDGAEGGYTMAAKQLKSKH